MAFTKASTFLPLIGFTLAVGGVIASASAGQPGAAQTRAETQIRTIYRKYELAMEHKDTHALENWETPDFSHVLPDGTVIWRWRSDYLTRALFKEAVAAPYDTVRIDRFTAKGNTVQVSATESTYLVFLDANGRRRVRETTGRTLDTWVRAGAGWKIERTQELSTAVAWDVPVPQAAPPPPASIHPSAPSPSTPSPSTPSGRIDDIA